MGEVGWWVVLSCLCSMELGGVTVVLVRFPERMLMFGLVVPSAFVVLGRLDQGAGSYQFAFESWVRATMWASVFVDVGVALGENRAARRAGPSCLTKLCDC